MSKTCRRLLIVVGVLYELALALYLIGSRGWLGSSQGPLAGVFLIPLGLPWNWWLDGLPPDLWPLAAVCTPALNVLLLWGLCRWRSRR